MHLVPQTVFAVKASFRFASSSSAILDALLTFIGEAWLAPDLRRGKAMTWDISRGWRSCDDIYGQNVRKRRILIRSILLINQDKIRLQCNHPGTIELAQPPKPLSRKTWRSIHVTLILIVAGSLRSLWKRGMEFYFKRLNNRTIGCQIWDPPCQELSFYPSYQTLSVDPSFRLAGPARMGCKNGQEGAAV